MKRQMVVAVVLAGAAALIWSAPARGRGADASAGAASARADRQQAMTESAGRILTGAREMGPWMQQLHARAELNDLSQLIGQTCERLQTMAQRMDRLTEQREYKNDEACCRELDRFQWRMGAMTRELEEAQQALRFVAEREGKTGDAPVSAEQVHVGGQQRDMERRMEALKTHVEELNAWMVERQGRPEFQETGRDMAQVRDRVQTMLLDMIRLRQGGTPDREQLREMDRLQDRLEVTMRELMEAHESLTQLANAP